MKNRIVMIVSICLVVAAVVTIVSVSLAYWGANKNESVTIGVPIDDNNASLKYQIYVPVTYISANQTARDAGPSGPSVYEPIRGTFTVSDSIFTFTKDPSDTRSIDGFAFVGWFGGIAMEYIHIPDTYTMTIGGSQITKPVRRIMSHPSCGDYMLAGNQVIKKIVIAQSVEEIDQGIFFGMTELAEVDFTIGEENSDICIRESAFMGCPKLSTFNLKRSQNEAWRAVEYIEANK